MKTIYIAILMVLLLVSSVVAGLSVNVEKAVDKTTADLNERLNYTMYYNITQNNASRVYVNDTLDVNVTFLSCSPAYANFTDRNLTWLFTNVSIGDYKVLLNVTVNASYGEEIENNFTVEMYSFVTNSTWDSTSDWDSGEKDDITTETDRYNQSAGTIELDFPYAEKHDNLTSYWRFENDATDETGTNDGTNNGADYNTSGKFGGAFQFVNANGDYINMGNDNSIKPSNEMTISLWIYPTDTAGNYNVLSMDAGTGMAGYIIRFSSDSKIDVGYIQTDKYYWKSDATTALSANQWYHLVLSYSRNSDVGKFYVDAVEKNSASLVTTSKSSVSTDLWVGREVDGDRYTFEGNIDEMKIYNKALNATEITALYNSGKQYVVSGNFSSNCSYSWVAQKATDEQIHYINMTVSNGDSSHYIDKIEIINCSTNATITTSNTDIDSNVTLNSSSFDNGLNGTNTDVKFKLYFVGNGTSTVTIEFIEIKTAPFNTTVVRGSNTISVLVEEPVVPEPEPEPEEVTLFTQVLPIVIVGVVAVTVFKVFVFLKGMFKGIREV